MAFFNHSEMSVIKDLFPSLKAPFTFNSFLGAALENPRMKDFLISFNPTELINFFLSQLCLQFASPPKQGVCPKTNKPISVIPYISRPFIFRSDPNFDFNSQLYIGKIPRHISEEKIQEALQVFGYVIRIYFHKVDGCAHVVFNESSSTINLLKKFGCLKVDGHFVSVSPMSFNNNAFNIVKYCKPV